MENKMELIGWFSTPNDSSLFVHGRVVVKGAADAACRSILQNTSNGSLFEMP
jgi:hypothetical protein